MNMAYKKGICKKGHILTPENTYVSKSTGNRMCKQCQLERTNLKTDDPIYYQNLLKKQKESYDNLPKEEKDARLKSNRDRWQRNGDRYRKQKNTKYYPKYANEIKTNALTITGNGKCACVKCGIADIDILTAEHPWGRTSKEKGDNKKNYVGKPLYIRIIKTNNIDNLVTLCMNCNWKKYMLEQKVKRASKTLDDEIALSSFLLLIDPIKRFIDNMNACLCLDNWSMKE